MYYFSADYSGLFQLKGKSRRTFTIVASTKNFFKFRFWGGVLLPAAGLLRTEVTGKVSWGFSILDTTAITRRYDNEPN